MKASEKYRLKALTCERLAQEATDRETEAAWTELAIEWHTLASRIAQDIKIKKLIERTLKRRDNPSPRLICRCRKSLGFIANLHLNFENSSNVSAEACSGRDPRPQLLHVPAHCTPNGYGAHGHTENLLSGLGQGNNHSFRWVS